jgi:energy-coupling factor transport system substrate-specific component
VSAAATTLARRRARSALRVDARTATMITLVSAAGLLMFLWPLFVAPPSGFAHDHDAAFVFVALLPGLIAIVLAEVTTGRMDTKAIAMLGVLSAIGAALRPMGVGAAGVETVFFLLVLAGRVYGPGFGFVLGSTTMFASAILTGGIGPWLPFQMLAASWVGLGAGLLPPMRGRPEIAMLAVYGAISAYAFGFFLNMWFWPFAIGTETQLSFVAGAPVLENLHRFFLFTIATSTAGWDTGRAITNVIAIVILGPATLLMLRRASRRASFGARPTFGSAASPVRELGHAVGERHGRAEAEDLDRTAG